MAPSNSPKPGSPFKNVLNRVRRTDDATNHQNEQEKELASGSHSVEYFSSQQQETEGSSRDSESGSRISPRKQARFSSPTEKVADIQFAAEMSESLLVECRKLQSTISEKDATLKSVQEELEEYRKKSSLLEDRLRSQSKIEEETRDANWSLETELQELRAKIAKFEESMTRMNSESGKLQTDKDTQLETIDELRARETELRKQSDKWRIKYENDRSALLKEKADLLEGNAALERKIAELKNNQATKRRSIDVPVQAQLGSATARSGSTESDYDDEFNTPQNSPPASPVKATPSRNSALETETARTSLAHAHRALTKERSEKLEAKRQLAKVQAELDALQNSGSGPKSKKSKFFGLGGTKQPVLRQPPLSLPRKATTSIYDDDNDEELPGSEEGWEEETGGFGGAQTSTTTSESEAFVSASEGQSEDFITTEDDYQAGRETMDEGNSSSGENTETESKTPTSFFKRMSMLSTKSRPTRAAVSSSDSDSDGESQHRSRPRSTRVKRSSYSLRNSQLLGSSDLDVTPQKAGPVEARTLSDEFMDLGSVEKLAAEQGKVAVPADEYEALKNKTWTPEELSETASSLGFILVPKDDHERLRTTEQASTTREFVVDSAKNHGLVAIAHSDYEKFTKPLGTKEVEEHASGMGLKVIKQENYDHLVSESQRQFSIEELQLKAKDQGCVVIPNTEYFDLVRVKNSPSQEEVVSKVGKFGMIALPKTDHYDLIQRIQNPSKQELEERAKSLGLVVLDETSANELNRKVRNPTSDELIASGKNLSMTVIPNSEFQNLIKKSTLPTKDEVSQFASAHDAILLDNSDYSILKTQAETPDEDHIQKKAQSRGLTVVPTSEYEQLHALTSNPPESHIKEKAESLGLVAVPSGHYDELKRVATAPTQEEVATFANTHNLVTIDKAEHQQLVASAKEPSAAELDAHAKTRGLVLLNASDHDSMKNSIENPSIDDIIVKAKAQGYATIKQDELKELQNPSHEKLEKNASSLGLVLLSSEKYHKMTEAEKAPIDKNFVASAAAGLGLSVLGAAEVTKLKSPPSFDQARDVIAGSGFKVIESDKLKSLETPTLDRVKELAKSHNLVPVEEKEYKELTSDLSETDIEERANKLGLVTVPTAIYQSLTSPGKDVIISKAREIGLEAIPANDYEELKSRPKEFKPTETEVIEHARGMGYEPIPSAELNELKRKVSTPNSDELHQHVSKAGLVAMDKPLLEELKRKAENPSRKDIDSHCAQSGLYALPISTFNELNRKAESPSYEELQAGAQKLKAVVVKEDEWEEHTNPISETSRAKLSDSGYEVVPKDELSDLRRKVEDPTKGEVIAAGEHVNMKVIDSSLYEELLKNSTDPDISVVTKLCAAKGFDVVPTESYKELLRKTETPSKEEVENWSSSLGLTVLAKTDYDDLVGKSSASDKEPTTPKELDLSSVSAKRNHFEDMIKKSNESPGKQTVATNAIKSMGYVPLTNEEYNRLLKNQKVFEPTKGDLINHGKALGLTVIGNDEYKSLLKRGGTSVSNGYHSRGGSLASFDADDRSLMSSSPTSPTHKPLMKRSNDDLSKSASTNSVEMKYVPADYLATLRRIVEEPSEEDVRTLAKRAGVDITSTSEAEQSLGSSLPEGFVSVPAMEYTALKEKAVQNSHAELSKDDFVSKAAGFGLVAVGLSEFKSLTDGKSKELSAEDVESNASRLGLVTVSNKVYNELVSRRPSNLPLSKDEIIAGASSHGMKAISEDEHESLVLKAASAAPVAVTEEVVKPGFRLISDDEYASLIQTSEQRAPQLSGEEYKGVGSAGEVEPRALTIEDLKEEAAKQGMLVVPSDTYSVSERNDRSSVDAGHATLRDSRGSPITYIRHPTTEHQSAVFSDGQSSYSSSEGGSIMSEAPISTSYNGKMPPQTPLPDVEQNVTHSRDASNSTGASRFRTVLQQQQQQKQLQNNNTNLGIVNLSSASIASHLSLNDRNMIPYITQVVIGEFLFKYTRKIGVSGISDNRHERYFWVHPYTLTLYWSPYNPASESRSGSSNKTKSAPIVSVTSIEDRNPLPPGLYHKSILIKSKDRVLKVTCPTRQRHNIWFNALTYLIKRNTNDLKFDEEDVEEDYGQQDNRVTQERARVGSATPTQHRMLSIRRSIAPEMNTPRYSRQSSIGSLQAKPERVSSRGVLRQAPITERE